METRCPPASTTRRPRRPPKAAKPGRPAAQPTIRHPGRHRRRAAAPRSLGKEGVWRVTADELKLTNLDKPLFEPRADGGGPITKRELIRYFARIAPTMLRTSTDRPLNLQRFPNGAGAMGFWQKDIPDTARRG
jgi:bifunctional non-homologous end joining protein LigD